MRALMRGTLKESSPHAWGCFQAAADGGRQGHVFPTRVGVFPARRACSPAAQRLPHTRGGVSRPQAAGAVPDVSSPHAWGCFWMPLWAGPLVGVFPTRVGVFPRRKGHTRTASGLPHTRGGVSSPTGTTTAVCPSSPHAWGCFRLARPENHVARVFPTRVGVFLPAPVRVRMPPCLPHTRGGVSTAIGSMGSRRLSSPHAWGCFLPTCYRLKPNWVFPTRVGVFLFSHCIAGALAGLPHTRGGVSRR